MFNFLQHGKIIDYTATAAINSGDIVVIGDIVGVAISDAAIGDEIAVQISGVFELPKDNAAIGQGKKVYIVNNVISATAGQTSVLAGYAIADAAAGDSVVSVKLIG